jgi:isoquinoline 1-oxidoreductase alpha subunit
MTLKLTVNGKLHTLEAPADKPLLWVLREDLGLTGSKFGCGIGQCGACTVHIDGQATRSCVMPASAVVGRSITTIEGVVESKVSVAGEAVRAAWRELDVVQCGYCQSGQMMSATALLAEKPSPSDEDIDAAMSGNLCRCATYQRIRAAIHRAADTLEA